jgi:hypothetical protein
LIDPPNQGNDPGSILVMHLTKIPRLGESIGFVYQQDDPPPYPTPVIDRLRRLIRDFREGRTKQGRHLANQPLASCSQTGSSDLSGVWGSLTDP